MSRLEFLKTLSDKDGTRRTGYMLLTPLLIILIWQFSSSLELVNALFLPGPWTVFSELVGLCLSAEILPDVGATFVRVFVSFFLAIIIGTPIGMMMGYFKKVYYSLEFVVDFFRSIPATALFPLFLLFFGIGDAAKIAIAVWGSTLIIVVNSMYGVKHANKLRLRAARAYKAKGFKLFRHVILPESLPEIVTGYRLGVSLCLIIVIVVEMFIGTNVGLGHRILDAQLVYKIPEMYSAIILTGVLGYAINKLFMLLEKKVLHYSGR
ncbi:ABC transporter permease [Candidatus Woesearchaeota archaeon]|jgi:ABC-type nitrate/sulfonate/bicarbonate transport system permease component|nr:ABC transporter permease [Candidatus Woesearchaeota archaeon]MBT3536991.1 ABC transporter permease [Candidatus Woesearchaeota archaeon]MBT4697601.1 ABC transporter permease [Candidatus Woesearchaeota archaeon]MBT4717715.1 ABC transporter permease [Candidatus Woesearchaeota archaeon]MBT7106699.1 ABC transporter permease [Candidatus Woesearchaeota archaeon]